MVYNYQLFLYLCTEQMEQHNCMIVTFDKKYLRDLYETGKTESKKFRFQPEIVEQDKRCINLMRRVSDTTELARYNGLNFENLKGDKQGVSSVRVNRQYRIEFTVNDDGGEPVLIVCNILELSNHYKK